MPKNYVQRSEKVVTPGRRFKHVMALTLDPQKEYQEGIIRCVTSREGEEGVASPIAFHPAKQTRRWIAGHASPKPFIQDSQASKVRAITFASQFVETGKGEGIIYAHVNDSFVRAYSVKADAIKKLLPR